MKQGSPQTAKHLWKTITYKEHASWQTHERLGDSMRLSPGEAGVPPGSAPGWPGTLPGPPFPPL